jgi:hypothetical protein
MLAADDGKPDTLAPMHLLLLLFFVQDITHGGEPMLAAWLMSRYFSRSPPRCPYCFGRTVNAWGEVLMRPFTF